MFESLSSKIQEVFKKLRKKGLLTHEDIKKATREIRLALLEADVNFRVVKELISRVAEQACRERVLRSLTPGQQVLKIFREELIKVMGGGESGIHLRKFPTKVMLVGLHGCGKTTSAAKLAYHFRSVGYSPLLVCADTRRPAAREQLEALGARIKVPFFGDDTKDSLSIVKEALRRAREEGVDVLIIDTSGRLHVDEETMRELREMKEEISPEEILLVTDATAGQDAVFVATTFDQALNLTGILLTKLDSDTRGGVALSIKMVTGKPIKFVGVGEEVSDIEPFYPERMANRILGMGDVLTLIEQVERVSREESKEICVEGFNLEDFLRYLRQIRKIGSFTKLLEMLPSEFVKGQSLTRQEIEKKEKELISFEAIINSMTREERRNPRILNGSRRRRIALGSGTTPSQVNKLLKHFDLMKKFMKDVKSGRRRVRLWGCKDW